MLHPKALRRKQLLEAGLELFSAQEIIWAGHTAADYARELRIMQEMLLNWCAGKNAVLPAPDAKE